MTVKGFDAVVFDLDGVITDTASLHSVAWKETFDKLLQLHANTPQADCTAFDIDTDYLKYVDGKPRYEGVASFLKSRNINLPFGESSDKPGTETCCAVGNAKNEAFNRLIGEKGPTVFETSINFIKTLIENDIKVALATSSKNCPTILKTAGIEAYFQCVVDGNYSETKALKGKPQPDIFVEACQNMDVEVSRCVVVEDAVSGIEAGKNGNFGLVIGIARHQNHSELKSSGADMVVSDAEELSIETIESWFETGLDEDNWSLRYTDSVPRSQKHREALLSIGNGNFVTRGAMCEARADKHNYPGTYMAGVYNNLESAVAGKMIWNEDLVNCPNWLFTTFRINKEEWVNLDDITVIDIERRLDFRSGLLSGWMLIEDKTGRKTMLETLRFASMDNKYIAALEHSVTPMNYSAEISILSSLDASHINAGVERYKQLDQHHLKSVKTGHKGNQYWLACQTRTSETEIAMAAYVTSNIGEATHKYEEYEGGIRVIYTAKLKENQDFVLQKTMSIANSLIVSNPLETVRKINIEENDFEILAAQSRRAWQKVWKECDIKITGDRRSQKLMRLNLYHMLITASPHSANHDTGIPARGLHGEAYRGHIFWDELYILPFYNIHYPQVTKATLMYRYRRLDAARKYAADHGYKGAMFPWQSGSNGIEQTQVIHLNPVSGRWDPDHSSLQRHISLAIALNIIRYYENTGDKPFMNDFGMEMLYEISRFWASATAPGDDKKYHIHKVMGPDEYHEKYPGAAVAGLSDNAYTNIMCIWLWNKTLKLTSALGDNLKPVFEKTGISFAEFDNWQQIAARLNIPVIDNDILEQFSGYNQLKELDWDGYKTKYGSIARLDRILKAEGLSPDVYKLAKQADTLMLFFNLNAEELAEIFEDRIDMPVSELLKKNFEYYYRRTSHGSTLSNVVHAQLAEELEDRELAWQLFQTALGSDFDDIQGGTTAEGIHTGAMAGSVLLALTAFAGINLKSNTVNIKPNLPESWNSMHFRFTFRGTGVEIIVYKDSINIKADKDIGIRIQNIPLVIEKDDWWNIEL